MPEVRAGIAIAIANLLCRICSRVRKGTARSTQRTCHTACGSLSACWLWAALRTAAVMTLIGPVAPDPPCLSAAGDMGIDQGTSISQPNG